MDDYPYFIPFLIKGRALILECNTVLEAEDIIRALVDTARALQTISSLNHFVLHSFTETFRIRDATTAEKSKFFSS